jgi:hypothetical protein
MQKRIRKRLATYLVDFIGDQRIEFLRDSPDG